MGKQIATLAEKKGHSIVAITTSKTQSPLDTCDVCIDFSTADAVLSNLQLACLANKPIVIGTTGWEHQIQKAKQLVDEMEGTAVYSPNFSLGVALFLELVQHAARLFSPFELYDISATETHHSEKKDTPSGTAKKIAQLFDNELHVTSIRSGYFPGTHTLAFDSPFDTITLTHTARNRDGFALGALQASEWILNKKGFWTYEALFRSVYTTYHTV